jgi:hypothetical protein
MDAKFQRPKGCDGVHSEFIIAIEVPNLVQEISSITPARAAFGSVSIFLTMIKVHLLWFCITILRLTFIQESMMNKQGYVEPGLSCTGVYKAPTGG